MCFGWLKKKEPVSLKDFATLADLEAWIDLHRELRMDAPNLCNDYARETRKLAEVDGYHLSLCLVFKGLEYGQTIFVKPDGTPDETVFHIGNLAIVTDTEDVFYVDLAWGKLTKLCQFKQGGNY